RQHLPFFVPEQDDLQLPAFGHDEQLVFGNDGAAAVASLQPQLPQTPAVLPPGGGKHARPVDDIQPFSLDDWAGDPGPQAAFVPEDLRYAWVALARTHRRDPVRRHVDNVAGHHRRGDCRGAVVVAPLLLAADRIDGDDPLGT